MKVLPEGGLKRIHVDQMAIRKSQREKLDLPSIAVYLFDNTLFCNGRRVRIKGESDIVQSFAKELPSGASVWIETLAEVEIYE